MINIFTNTILAVIALFLALKVYKEWREADSEGRTVIKYIGIACSVMYVVSTAWSLIG